MLLGDGGLGKTVALLKLFFDCKSRDIVTDAGQILVPLYLNANTLAQAGNLLDALREVLKIKDTNILRQELEYTENLLIMIDGLNEISPRIARGFPQIIDNLCSEFEHHVIILTSRKQETLRETSILNHNAVRLKFKPYEMLNLDLSTCRKSLEEAIGAKPAAQILERLGGRHDNLIENPMMLYLASKAHSKIRETLEAGDRLNKGRILRIVNEEWFESRWWSERDEENKLKPRMAFRLLTTLAKEMTQQRSVNLSHDEVTAVIRDAAQQNSLPLDYSEQTFEQLIAWPMIRTQSIQRRGTLLRREISNDIRFIHDSFLEYYAAEWLVDQLGTSDWTNTFDQIGAIEQYPIWSESVYLMCDLLDADQRSKIVQRYQDWQRYEYGLNYLVKHAAFSKSPEKALDIIRPSYVRSKATKLQSVGPLVDDLDTVIEVALDRNDLVPAFKFAVLKDEMATPGERAMLGAELVIRARMGEIEQALADIEYFGTEDDQLLVNVEAAVQLWKNDSKLAEKHLNQIDPISSNSSPEVLEMAATRVASVHPAAAAELARAIPEPSPLYSISTGVENPNKGRCIFQIFKELTQRDLDVAIALADQIGEPFDKGYSYVAIGAALLPKHASEAFGIFKAALSELQGITRSEALPYMLARYVLWHIPDMDVDSSICAFQGIAELIPEYAGELGSVDILDAKISENPASWVESLAEFPNGPLKDLLTSS